MGNGNEIFAEDRRYNRRDKSRQEAIREQLETKQTH